jgi:hypothetical protein
LWGAIIVPRPGFLVEVERADAEILLLDGRLAKVFFTRDISAQPGGYDSVAGLTSPDEIVEADITAVNRTMRARSRRASWASLLAGDQPWLSAIPINLDLVHADEDDWQAIDGDALLSAAIAACIRPGIGLAVATKVLHLKRPRLVPILDSLVAQMLGVNLPDSPTTDERLAVGRRLTMLIRREGRRNLEVLHSIQTELEKDGITRSLVRIFDAIIWYSHPAAGIPGVKRSITVELA